MLKREALNDDPILGVERILKCRSRLLAGNEQLIRRHTNADRCCNAGNRGKAFGECHNAVSIAFTGCALPNAPGAGSKSQVSASDCLQFLEEGALRTAG